jgi:predicted nuclease of predicted toxin-antitoxin system
MLFKVDENVHPDATALLRDHGHDALTVGQQQLQGQKDDVIARVCQTEGRAILTLDLDFANIRDYPPQEYAGIVVLRLHDQSRRSILRVISRLIPHFAEHPLTGRLWVVDESGLRIRPS